MTTLRESGWYWCTLMRDPDNPQVLEWCDDTDEPGYWQVGISLYDDSDVIVISDRLIPPELPK